MDEDHEDADDVDAETDILNGSDVAVWTGPISPETAWMRPPSTLPFISPHLPGVGGQLKRRCTHFVVTELLDLPPQLSVSTSSPQDFISYNYWLLVRRSGLTTEDVQRRLSLEFGLGSHRLVGVAGRKDKTAVATQWFSVPSYSKELERRLELSEFEYLAPPLELLKVVMTKSKLRQNEHVGNKFEIVVSGIEQDIDASERLNRCLAVESELRSSGWPNYYGPQRFGKSCSGALKYSKLLVRISAETNKAARKKLENKLMNDPTESFAFAAFAAMIFNVYVATRIEAGHFKEWLEGDILTRRYLTPKSHDKGAGTAAGATPPPFISATDVPSLVAAFSAGLIAVSGPLVGRQLRRPDPATPAGTLEDGVLSSITGFPASSYGATPAWGCRRAARLPLPSDMEISTHADGMVFRFSLPNGAYATSLLREFTKGETKEAEKRGNGGDDDDEDEDEDEDMALLPPPTPRKKATVEDARFPASLKVAMKGQRLERWLIDLKAGAMKTASEGRKQPTKDQLLLIAVHTQLKENTKLQSD